MERVSAIACGHEDAIDLDRLRHDPLMKVAVGRCPQTGAPLASQSTISRLENAPSKTEAARLCAALLDQFGTTVKPGRLEILDIDDTFSDAIPAFVAYYESHPPRWEPTDQAGWVITGPAAHLGTATRYSKLTDFGGLDVIQAQPRLWDAYRNGEFPLLRDGKPAIFDSRRSSRRERKRSPPALTISRQMKASPVVAGARQLFCADGLNGETWRMWVRRTGVSKNVHSAVVGL